VKAGFCVSGNGSLFRAAIANREALSIDSALLAIESKAAPDLEAFASERGVRCVRLTPDDRPAFDRDLTALLIDAALDLLVLTFDRILPPPLVRHYAGHIINIHPALLPAFAGMHGMRRTLASGARFGGATIHEVVDEVDAGPIVAQAVVAIVPEETLAEYGRRVYELLEPMYLQVIAWYGEGRVEHDAAGRVVIRGARYDTLPLSPALERFGLRG
jgi:phosphoribosylglycinamide formyltransferase-1